MAAVLEMGTLCRATASTGMNDRWVFEGDFLFLVTGLHEVWYMPLCTALMVMHEAWSRELAWKNGVVNLHEAWSRELA